MVSGKNTLKFALMPLLILFCVAPVLAQVSVTQVWNRTVAEGFNTETAFDVALDSSGNVYVTGGVTDASTGDSFWLTIKYDSSGNQVFNTTFNKLVTETISENPGEIAVDSSGNIYVTGYTYTSLGGKAIWHTIKYDSSGNEVWNATFDGGGVTDIANGIAVDSAANVYVTGHTVPLSGGDSKIVTIKYDSSGNEVWNKTYDSPSGVETDQGFDVLVDSSGNVYVAGEAGLTGGDTDSFLIKYDSSGNEVWNASFHGGDADGAYGVALDSASGDIYIVGYTLTLSGTTQLLMIKYNTTGDEQWNKKLNISDIQDIGHAVALDSSGDIYIAGETFINGVDPDWLIMRFDSDGNHVWNLTVDGGGTTGNGDSARGIAVDSSNNVYVTGYYEPVVNFDFLTIKYSQQVVGDNCPSLTGPYQGCPFGDKNIVALHTINIGGGGSTNVPLEDVTVRVFDRNDPNFQAVAGSKNPKGDLYDDIYEADAGKISQCTTDSNGECIAGEETAGDYLVIVKYFDAETGKTVYTGKQKGAADFDFSGLATRDFQIMKVYKNGVFKEFRGGSKLVVIGSYLEMIVPESAVWEGDNSIYPFIFTSDSDWEVDVCAEVPSGYVINGVYDAAGNFVPSTDCVQLFVTGETKVIAFDVTDVGSPEPSFDAVINLNHNGKKKTIKHTVNDVRKNPKQNNQQGKPGNSPQGKPGKSTGNVISDLTGSHLGLVAALLVLAGLVILVVTRLRRK
jgi:hypothetical protein